MYSALRLIKEHLAASREYFQGTVADISEEYLHKRLGGTSLPVGATYAHLIFSEDIIVQGMLKGKAPLSQTIWKDKTGADKQMPDPTKSDWSEAHSKWANSVKINLPQLRKYAQAVFSATDEYINSLTDEDLAEEMDLSAVHLGKKTVGWAISSLVVGHIDNITGELAALKGVHGAKGYPF